ncbi:crosslink repair DNA glycosylase YcaQ family protein [Micrococcaceae bacterium Sec5.7]
MLATALNLMGLTDPGSRIDLIQCYDEFVMRYSESRHYLGGSVPAFPVEQAPMHVVLLDGRMIRTWRHAFSRGRCELDVRTAGSLDPAAGQALEQAVDRYSLFLEMPAVRL